MSLPKPTPREREIADLAADTDELADLLAQVLATYREELLRPFDELRRDVESLNDARMAKWLDELLKTARGVP